MKTQVTSKSKGTFLMISKSYPGRIHDDQIVKREHTAEKLPRQSAHYVDGGYDGLKRTTLNIT